MKLIHTPQINSSPLNPCDINLINTILKCTPVWDINKSYLHLNETLTLYSYTLSLSYTHIHTPTHTNTHTHKHTHTNTYTHISQPHFQPSTNSIYALPLWSRIERSSLPCVCGQKSKRLTEECQPVSANSIKVKKKKAVAHESTTPVPLSTIGAWSGEGLSAIITKQQQQQGLVTDRLMPWTAREAARFHLWVQFFKVNTCADLSASVSPSFALR